MTVALIGGQLVVNWCESILFHWKIKFKQINFRYNYINSFVPHLQQMNIVLIFDFNKFSLYFLHLLTTAIFNIENTPSLVKNNHPYRIHSEYFSDSTVVCKIYKYSLIILLYREIYITKLAKVFFLIWMSSIDRRI